MKYGRLNYSPVCEQQHNMWLKFQIEYQRHKPRRFQRQIPLLCLLLDPRED